MTIDTTKLNAGQLVQRIMRAMDGADRPESTAKYAEHIAAEILKLPADYWTNGEPASDAAVEIERLRAALADTLSEVVEVRKNIIEASALDPNRGDKKYDEAYQKETARLDAMIYRARAALEQEAPK